MYVARLLEKSSFFSGRASFLGAADLNGTIHNAAEDGQLEYLTALVENDPICVHARDEAGCTPLLLVGQ